MCLQLAPSYEVLRDGFFTSFIFMAWQSGGYPNVKVIYLAVHPLPGLLCGEKEAQAHIAFHDLLCQRRTQTNRWEP